MLTPFVCIKTKWLGLYLKRGGFVTNYLIAGLSYEMSHLIKHVIRSLLVYNIHSLKGFAL